MKVPVEIDLSRASSTLFTSHWGRGGLETGDYMLGTFRAHVHLSHNVTSG